MILDQSTFSLEYIYILCPGSNIRKYQFSKHTHFIERYLGIFIISGQKANAK